MNLIERYINEIYTIKNYEWIRRHLFLSNGIGDAIPIEPTRAQREAIISKENNRIYLMPRQSGKTTLICIDSITEAINTENAHILIAISNNVGKRYIQTLIANILSASDLMKLVVRVSSDGIMFNNGSHIRIMVPSRVSLRGMSFDIAYVDEFTTFAEDIVSDIFITLAHKENAKLMMLGTSLDNRIQQTGVRGIRPTIL